MNLYNTPVGVSSVIIGCVTASYVGAFNPSTSALALLFVFLIQITLNLQNNFCELYYHHNDMLDMGLNGNTYQLSRIDSIPLRMATMVMAILSMTVGLGLATTGGWPTLLIGLIIFGSLFYYNAGKHAIRFSPWVPLLVFCFYGPVAVLGTYILQTFRVLPNPWSWQACWITVYMSIISGFLAVNVWMIRERMRSVILPKRYVTYYTGSRIKILKWIFLSSTFIIFILQITLCYMTNFGGLSTITYIAPTICFAVNLYIWKKGHNVNADKKLFRRLAFLTIGVMFFYALSTLAYYLILKNAVPVDQIHMY